MFGGLGTTEILIVVGILILLFGAKQIPKIAKSIGQSKREFRRAMNETGDIHAEDADKSVIRR
jgi:sec-independent protein translocase protein TatA